MNEDDLERIYVETLEGAPTGGTERERQAWRNGVVEALDAVAVALGMFSGPGGVAELPKAQWVPPQILAHYGIRKDTR